MKLKKGQILIDTNDLSVNSDKLTKDQIALAMVLLDTTVMDVLDIDPQMLDVLRVKGIAELTNLLVK